MTFVYPFKELFHYWDELHYLLGHRYDASQSEVAVHNSKMGSHVRVSCDEATSKHLQTLLTAPPVQEAWENIVKPELELCNSGRASYDFLWLLFKPGDIVFLRSRGSDKQLAGFVVMNFLYLSSNGSQSPLVGPHPTDRWQLTLWNLAYENGCLRRRARVVYVNRFYGVQAITELAAFPTKFAPDPEALRSQLIDRGKRYYRIVCDQQSYMRYNGLVISDKPYHVSGFTEIRH